ncbi:hypothetical protein PR003_g7792 [Phytophthora rubi]|uniref:Uncharacterized protein n=1 Tax=Phytophthora rubi TaxID=129364 RepID=A0A6A4FSZ0_9STRA|nr:hypothetical protein PR002_g7638 [Phytophthora rubi]KAE9345735.1 hypothetical protein PR003_g7792 [Phytophthora rubi]
MIRGKNTNNAYTHDALQRSWCAFIHRWNAAGRKGLSFTSWLEDREATRSTRSIGDIRTRVCSASGVCATCTRCQDRPRPTREEGERQLMSCALSKDERRWLRAAEILKLQQVVAADVVRRASEAS